MIDFILYFQDESYHQNFQYMCTFVKTLGRSWSKFKSNGLIEPSADKIKKILDATRSILNNRAGPVKTTQAITSARNWLMLLARPAL